MSSKDCMQMKSFSISDVAIMTDYCLQGCKDIVNSSQTRYREHTVEHTICGITYCGRFIHYIFRKIY